jgi:Tfp pilus assembly protein PilV
VRGVTLISVLVALLVAGIGVLSLARLLGVGVAATTQNQTVSTAAVLGNSFWGVVQANPSLLGSSSFAGTFSSTNVSSAPSELRPWLTQAVSGLPGGSVAIATGVDAGSGSSCAASSGCTVTLTMNWNQVAASGIAERTRSHVFYFQFGL